MLSQFIFPTDLTLWFAFKDQPYVIEFFFKCMLHNKTALQKFCVQLLGCSSRLNNLKFYRIFVNYTFKGILRHSVFTYLKFSFVNTFKINIMYNKTKYNINSLPNLPPIATKAAPLGYGRILS